jgi:hypothetical protein
MTWATVVHGAQATYSEWWRGGAGVRREPVVGHATSHMGGGGV